MGTVLTLDDWWDGPLWGMATYGNQTCIFERVFSEEIDDYLDQYYLTPVSDEQGQCFIGWRSIILQSTPSNGITAADI